jgi:hypothetical protein
MDIKPGYKTTEFWVTAVVNIVTAVIGILAVRGLVTAEEGNLYVALASAVVAAMAPLVLAYVTARYAQSRAQVKIAANGGPA